jgi:ADP-dependent glucokinase
VKYLVFSYQFRSEKLHSFKNYLATQDLKENIVHLELASIGDKALMKSILDHNIFQEVDSLGLNEQELLFLSYAHGNGPHSQYYEELKGQPELYKIVDILEWALNSLASDTSKNKLTRIHFHCLMFHIIAEQESSNWSNTASALLAGSKIAAKQACGFDYGDETKNDLLENLLQFQVAHSIDNNNNVVFEIEKDKFLKFNSSNPVIEFKRGITRFYFTPVLVCKKPLKTVGLGDAISSNALFYNEFKHF